MSIPFVRPLYPPSSPRKSEGGQDVVAVKRAVSRAGYWLWQPFDDRYSEAFSLAVKKLRVEHGLKASQTYDEKTQAVLAELPVPEHPGEKPFDMVALQLLAEEEKRREKPPAQQKAEELLAYCKLFDGPYAWGGEHDGSLVDDDPHDGYDCSSSVSSALAHAGLLGSSIAHVSGWFKSWGERGRGQYVTVHAADDHVWMDFTIPGRAWQRFDTSPHGDGSPGPRVRTRLRDTSRFVQRHPRGL